MDLPNQIGEKLKQVLSESKDNQEKDVCDNENTTVLLSEE